MRDYQTKANQGALPDSNAATKYGAGEVNSLRTEAKTAVSRAGLTLAPQDGTGEDTSQLAQALLINGVSGQAMQDSGSADAIILTPITGASGLSLPPDYSTLDGAEFSFFSAFANLTTTPTASIGQTAGSQFGAKTIVREDGSALIAGDIVPSAMTVLRRDGSGDRWLLIRGSGSVPLIGLVDNATAQRVEITNSNLVLGDQASIANYTISRGRTDSRLFISGSDTFGNGADLRLNGSTVTNPGQWQVFQDGILRARIDATDNNADIDLLTNSAQVRFKIDGTDGHIAVGNGLPSTIWQESIYSDTSDDTTGALKCDNSSATRLFNVNGDGAISTGVAAGSPYNNTTASAANVFVGGTGQLFRSTSSVRFKTAIEPMDDAYADSVLDFQPIFYRSTSDSDNPEWSFWGLLAEDVAEIDPRLVHWGYPKKTFEREIKRLKSEQVIVPVTHVVPITTTEIVTETVIIDGEEIERTIERSNIAKDETGKKLYKTETVEITETVTNEITETVEVTEPDFDAPMIPDGVAYERIVPALINLMKRQRDEIAALKTRLDAAGI